MIDIKQTRSVEKIPVKIESSPKYRQKLYRQQIKEHKAEIKRLKLHTRIAKLNTKLESL